MDGEPCLGAMTGEPTGPSTGTSRGDDHVGDGADLAGRIARERKRGARTETKNPAEPPDGPEGNGRGEVPFLQRVDGFAGEARRRLVARDHRRRGGRPIASCRASDQGTYEACAAAGG